MSDYPLMNKALSPLLNEGETIKHPIHAVLEQDGRWYFSYFAFTEDAFLVALSHENNNAPWSKRIPLDVESVMIKDYKVFKNREYAINIAFKNNSPIKIIIPYRDFTYGNQSEKIQQFIKHLQELSPQNSHPALKDINGTRLRRQYFNLPIYLILPVIPLCISLFAMVLIRHNGFSWGEWLTISFEGISFVLALLSPFVLLSALNRFLFGKIVSVINDNGIYFENNFVPWNKIKKITYIPDTPSEYQHSVPHHCYTRLKLTVESETGEDYDVEIKNFPLYGLFKIKKYCSNKKIKFAAKNVLWALVFLGIAMIASLLIPFV